MKKYLFTVMALAVFAVCFVASDDVEEQDTSTSSSKDLFEEDDAEEMEVKEDEAEDYTFPDWIEGTWTAKIMSFGRVSVLKLVIRDNYVIYYGSDGDILTEGKGEISDGLLYFGETFFPVDERKKLIMVDDSHYFTHSEHPSDEVIRATTPEQDKEMRIMSSLNQLKNDSKSLLDELSVMMSRGQIDMARYVYIQQTLITYKDEQIKLAQQLGDSKMVMEYQQQKEMLLESFRMMDDGY